MNKVLNDLKGYELRKTTNYNLKRGNVTKDLKASEGPIEITRGFSEFTEKVDALSVLPAVGGYVKKIMEFTHSLRLVDDASRLAYTNDNLRRIGNMDKTLKQEAKGFGENGIQAFETRFCMKYENMKQELKEAEKAIAEQSVTVSDLKSQLKRLEKELKALEGNKVANALKIENLKKKRDEKAVELYNARLAKLKLGLRKASLKNLGEKNVLDMAKDINKSNRNEVALKIIGGMAHIAADIILAISLPVSKVIVTVLQLPLVFGKLIKAIDIHIFKKLREKSEASRKEEMMRAQIKNLNKAIGTDKFNEIVANEKDMAKQLEKIEKTEDTEIKSAFETSRRSQDVLCAKPKWNLRMFKIRAVEDNDRLENTAKFVLKHIKELPDEDKIKEELDKDYLSVETKLKLTKGLKQVQEGKERIKAMVEVLGIDNADDFIKEVKEYKSKKQEDLIALGNNKERMNNANKLQFADRKNKLKERLVEAMKQKL